jgi:hypothetical protein
VERIVQGSVKVFRFLEEVWIGRLKKTSQHKTKEEKDLEKHSDALCTLDFFGVVFLILGENI